MRGGSRLLSALVLLGAASAAVEFVAPARSVMAARPDDPAAALAKIGDALKTATDAAGWNDVLAQFNDVDKEVTDPEKRKALALDGWRKRVTDGRAAFFRAKVEEGVHATLKTLVVAKAREKDGPAPADGGPAPGSFAAARAWIGKELAKEVWAAVALENGLTAYETQQFWRERPKKKVLEADYGSGSFLAREGRVETPRTRAWWHEAVPAARARWMVAEFVEACGQFDVVRRDESKKCDGCGATGVKKSNNADRTVSAEVCRTCYGAGTFVKVLYR